MIDTLVFGNDGSLKGYKPIEELAFIYQWDSVLSRITSTITNKIEVDSKSYIEIVDSYEITVSDKLLRVHKYLGVLVNDQGEFDTQGVFVENLGTVHYQGFHSSKIINLHEAQSSMQDWLTPSNIELVNRYIQDSILYSGVLPVISQDEIDEEVKGDLKLDLAEEDNRND